MSIITLTSDWGTHDYFAGALKGRLLSKIPDAQIVDISHDIPAHNVVYASYVFGNTYKHFPKGTIHLVTVQASIEQPKNAPEMNISDYLAVDMDGHLFIVSNSGLISLLSNGVAPKIVKLQFPKKNYTKHYFNELSEVISVLYKSKDVASLGEYTDDFLQVTSLNPIVEPSVIRGTVVYIDRFGNLVTNIERQLFEEVRSQRRFIISLRKHEYDINALSEWYDDVVEGEKVAMFNAADKLEIGLNKGIANKLFGLKIGDTIRIDFYDN